jgi:hypothetical protein
VPFALSSLVVGKRNVVRYVVRPSEELVSTGFAVDGGDAAWGCPARGVRVD